MATAILAVQGAFAEHARALGRLGEATVLLREQGMLGPLRERIESGMSVLATCAGLTLLARDLEGDDPPQASRFATFPMTVRRSAYGRQLGSFRTTVGFAGVGNVPATFIRAPQIVALDGGAEALASADGLPVAARHGSQIACAFHPELDDDLRIHGLFLPLRSRARRRGSCANQQHPVEWKPIDEEATMTTVPAGHPEKPQGADGFKLLERMNGGHHEKLALWGLSFLPIAEGARALDIGCGGGANLARLLERAPLGHVDGVDYSPVSVEASADFNVGAIEAGRCAVREGDASALPFPDSAFDVATAFETTYYWNLDTAFREVKRVLKPGGHFLVCNEDDGCDPESLALAAEIPGMAMHSAEALQDALVQAGFEIRAIERVPEKGHLAIIAQA